MPTYTEESAQDLADNFNNIDNGSRGEEFSLKKQLNLKRRESLNKLPMYLSVPLTATIMKTLIEQDPKKKFKAGLSGFAMGTGAVTGYKSGESLLDYLDIKNPYGRFLGKAAPAMASALTTKALINYIWPDKKEEGKDD